MLIGETTVICFIYSIYIINFIRYMFYMLYVQPVIYLQTRGFVSFATTKNILHFGVVSTRENFKGCHIDRE